MFHNRAGRSLHTKNKPMPFVKLRVLLADDYEAWRERPRELM